MDGLSIGQALGENIIGSIANLAGNHGKDRMLKLGRARWEIHLQKVLIMNRHSRLRLSHQLRDCCQMKAKKHLLSKLALH